MCGDFELSWKVAGGPCGIPIVPCGSLGCLFPVGGDLRVSKKASILATLRDMPVAGFVNIGAHRDSAAELRMVIDVEVFIQQDNKSGQ